MIVVICMYRAIKFLHSFWFCNTMHTGSKVLCLNFLVTNCLIIILRLLTCMVSDYFLNRWFGLYSYKVIWTTSLATYSTASRACQSKVYRPRCCCIKVGTNIEAVAVCGVAGSFFRLHSFTTRPFPQSGFCVCD